jgi:uncharacterized membrane protein HdeD (DUF308 family)
LGIFGVVLAVGGYVLWTEQIWAQHDSDGYWDFLVIVLVVALATLAATTCRLMLSAPQLVRTLFPATAGVAALAAACVAVMVLRENGDGWQLFAVLLILTVLGEILAPILDRYLTAQKPARERTLATLAGVAVIAVRGDGRTVRIGETAHRLAANEDVVVRPS